MSTDGRAAIPAIAALGHPCPSYAGAPGRHTPVCVTRHLFRTTKRHSSRLDWCIFSHNRGGYERSTDPNPRKLKIGHIVILKPNKYPAQIKGLPGVELVDHLMVQSMPSTLFFSVTFSVFIMLKPLSHFTQNCNFAWTYPINCQYSCQFLCSCCQEN